MPLQTRVCMQPNHRQEIALERIEFAIETLACTLITYGGSNDTTKLAIGAVRKAVAPVLTNILAAE